MSVFDYELPDDRVAQEPLSTRDASRLLVVATDGTLRDERFIALPSLLRAGDVCVANDTRVRNARLDGRREDGGRAELLVLERHDGGAFLCLARPARRLRSGARVSFDGTALTATVIADSSDHPAARLVSFEPAGADLDTTIQRIGSVPTPPYIRRRLADATRYQTVYARGSPVAAAAPTAGLHFTERVIDALKQRGIGWVTVTLDVGLATFAPMHDGKTPHVRHERFAVSDESARAINDARRHGGRVVAIGTTTVRALETQAQRDGSVRPGSGSTDLLITPGHRFRAVDALLTNFHQPRSSLLSLLAAFIGERWRAAYRHALDSGYRFLSFGDCMLCWREQ